MNQVEYKALKKLAIKQFGADDAESLTFFVEKMEKQSKYLKIGAIALGIISLPLTLIAIGIPLLIGALVLYFVSRKTTKKGIAFKEYINNDPELSKS